MKAAEDAKAVAASAAVAAQNVDLDSLSNKVNAVMAATPFHVSIEQLGLESEARLLSIDVEGGRLVLHIQNGVADGRVLIVDINSGAVLGEMSLPPPLQ